MNRNALRVTTCCIASAVLISGNSFMSNAATTAGVSNIKAVVAETDKNDSRVAGASLDMSHYIAKTQDIITEQNKSEYANIAIAQVDNYVYIRSAPDSESEDNILGKLHNNSAANVIGSEGDWYKITSGNVEGYVKKEFVVVGDEELSKSVGHRLANVNGSGLNVRQEASTESGTIGQVAEGEKLTVVDEIDGWVKISVEEGEGYVSSDYVECVTNYVVAESKEEEEARLKKEEEERKAAEEAARAAEEARRAEAAAAANRSSTGGSSSSSGGSSSGGGSSSQPAKSYAPPASSNGQAVANYAVQFNGNPYVYGGTSLTNGADCSGFVMSVYAAFGVGLPHSSSALRGVGYGVSYAEAAPGDIICYSGHVGIYIGGGQIIHASTAATGIKISNATYREIVAVRRIF